MTTLRFKRSETKHAPMGSGYKIGDLDWHMERLACLGILLMGFLQYWMQQAPYKQLFYFPHHRKPGLLFAREACGRKHAQEAQILPL